MINGHIGSRGFFQLIFGGVALALLGWVFTVVQGTAVTVGIQSEQIAALRTQITMLTKISMDDRYTGRDAARDFLIRDHQIKNLQQWRDRTEGRFHAE